MEKLSAYVEISKDDYECGYWTDSMIKQHLMDEVDYKVKELFCLSAICKTYEYNDSFKIVKQLFEDKYGFKYYQFSAIVEVDIYE